MQVLLISLNSYPEISSVLQLVESKKQTEDLGFPFPKEKTLQMPFWLYVPHPFHRWNSQLKRCITPIKPQEPSKTFLKNKLTARMKYLLVRTALYNCSEGVSLYQAPWKPLLWDWRQKQPGVGSCAAIAKTSMNLHQEASGSELMAKQEQPGRATRKEISLELGHAALPLTALLGAREKQNKEGNAIGYYSGEDFTESCLGNMW